MTRADLPLDRRAFVSAGLSIAGAALAAPAIARPAAEPVATTRHGRVRGRVKDGIYRFLGIRYGADTAPRASSRRCPPTPWQEVRDAYAYGAAAPQRKIEDLRREERELFAIAPYLKLGT